MAIGRTEDRNTPGNPLGHKPRRDVRGPIRVTHLGPRSTRPHTKAGHMTAIDRPIPTAKILARRGPSTHGDLIGPPFQRGLGWAASLRVDRRPSLRIDGRRCPRRCDSTTVGGIASAFAGTGATALRRRERPVPAVSWYNEAVTVVMTLRFRPRRRTMVGLGVRHCAQRSRR